eukprot:768393-Hanusia_phi.AAC.3
MQSAAANTSSPPFSPPDNASPTADAKTCSQGLFKVDPQDLESVTSRAFPHCPLPCSASPSEQRFFTPLALRRVYRTLQTS